MSSINTCYTSFHLIQAIGEGKWDTVIINPSHVYTIQLMIKLEDPIMHQGVVWNLLKFSKDRFFFIVPVSIENCLLSSGNVMRIQFDLND